MVCVLVCIVRVQIWVTCPSIPKWSLTLTFRLEFEAPADCMAVHMHATKSVRVRAVERAGNIVVLALIVNVHYCH